VGDHHGQLPEAGLVHVMASWPPNAPSTITVADFWTGQIGAILEGIGDVVFTLSPLAHSCVVFDTPSESRTIFPLFMSVLPEALQRTISFVSDLLHAGRLVRGGRVFAPFDKVRQWSSTR